MALSHTDPTPSGGPAGAQGLGSILFGPDGTPDLAAVGEPECFHDLHLDEVVASVTKRFDEYHLTPFFHLPLRDVSTVRYRHAVFADLGREPIAGAISAFADAMRSARLRVAAAEGRYYRWEKARWFLDAVIAYCTGVEDLLEDLTRTTIESEGLVMFRAYLARYVDTDGFRAMAAQTRRVASELAEIRYTVLIRGSRVTVGVYDDQPDYTAVIESTFDRFGRSDEHGFPTPGGVPGELNHIEARILDAVADLHPATFDELDAVVTRWQDAFDPVVVAFDREIHFYVAYLAYAAALSDAGLAFCLPDITEPHEISVDDAFDAALAARLAAQGSRVVCNDVRVHPGERNVVVTGPNQGGKTTFARMVGQLHFLASVGCPVPARRAAVPLADEVFCHFEREERVESLRGKLEDELVRLKWILERATSDSVVVLNETFTSTTSGDARRLGAEVLHRLAHLGVLTVYVTFIDELASSSDTTVSMVSLVADDDPTARTYKVVRKPADGLAHAEALARKYGLTYPEIRERLAR